MKELTKYGDLSEHPIKDFHTREFKGLKCIIIPYLTTNYGFIVIDNTSQKFCIIDGGDPAQIIKAIEHFELDESNLEFVLTTHKHWDHAGGNSGLKERFPEVPFYGSMAD